MACSAPGPRNARVRHIRSSVAVHLKTVPLRMATPICSPYG